MSRVSTIVAVMLCASAHVYVGRVPGALAGDPKSDHALWQGEWKLKKLELRGPGGTTVIGVAKGTLSIVGDKATMTLQIDNKKKEYEYSFRLNPTTDPKEVDYAMADGSTIRGVYSIDGNVLKRCHSQPGEARPKDFIKGMYSEWVRQIP